MKSALTLFATTLCLYGTTMAQNLPTVSFQTPEIVRIQWSIDGQTKDNGTGVIKPNLNLKETQTKVTETKDEIQYASSEMIVRMNRQTGALTFINKRTGKVLLTENEQNPHEGEPTIQTRVLYDNKSAHMIETANGKVTVKDTLRVDTIGRSTRYTINFQFTDQEALYGMGCHIEDYMNLNGKTLHLTQHNLKASVPVLNSTAGYGLLFDAGCAIKMENGSIELDAAKEIDYYLMMGQNLDQLVAQYRLLTGDCPMMPRYMFGYTQSKERYSSQAELIQVLREYRQRQVPIDMIVQDWNYWPQGWGYMKMDERYYPNPKALADTIHNLHAKLMVSIWPNPQWCPEAEDFKQHGMMLEHDVYDVFNPEARKHYWSYADKEFFQKGFDAWWCDSSEPLDGDWNTPVVSDTKEPYGPQSHAQRYRLNKEILSDALGAERSNLYSLYHAQGIYENQRATSQDKRVLNLTRSSYAGQQRYATVTWNGDTHASWDSFREQIPGGLNFMATGCPYWSVDIGSFFTRSDRRWFYKGEFPNGVKDDNYKEYYTRMLQWGTFLPMMRSHGSDTPREIWRFGDPGSTYYDAILRMIKLRYSLLPYTYSLGAKVTFDNYTMTRLLAFDFADDKAVWDIKDQFMFGNILVNPVTQPKAQSRKVYLPKNTQWWNYWNNQLVDGGQTIDCPTPIDQLPLFVKAGTILTIGPDVQYSDEKVNGDITIRVYPGADADFVLYEDEGNNYNYESGKYSKISLHWDNKRQQLSIGEVQGDFEGMIHNRTFTVEVIGTDKSQSKKKMNTGVVKVDYSGVQKRVKF